MRLSYVMMNKYKLRVPKRQQLTISISRLTGDISYIYQIIGRTRI